MVELLENGVKKVKNMPNVYRRQDAPKVYDMNASIYIWKRDVLLNSDNLFTENTSLFIMPEEKSIDIDTNLDWEIVKLILSSSAKN